MIDLHLHTFFSDGDIYDIGEIVRHCDTISITDHNSIQAYNFFQNALHGKKMLIGCEVTVDRAPDYLLYFPDGSPLVEIEHELEEIRMAEEQVVKECYYCLGYLDWEKDIARAFPRKQRCKNARIRDLAAIIHLYESGMDYDNGNFDFCDLKIARKQRWEYAEKNGNPIPKDAAFFLAQKYCGQIVLAHPIRTAIRNCPKNLTVVSIIKDKILTLMNCYASKGGKNIEWEYFSVLHMEKYGLSSSDIATLRAIVWENANLYNFSFTVGTDSHTVNNYRESAKWLAESEAIIGSKLAKWAI